MPDRKSPCKDWGRKLFETPYIVEDYDDTCRYFPCPNCMELAWFKKDLIREDHFQLCPKCGNPINTEER